MSRPAKKLLRAGLLMLEIAAATMVCSASATAENATIARHRRIDRTQFTDAEIIDGFMRTAFGAEFQLAGRVDRIRKFDVPVRVAVTSHARPDRRAEVAAVVADIAKRIQHLEIGMTDRDDANLNVVLVRDRNLNAAIAATYGIERASEIHKSLDPQCLSGFRKDERYAIQHADVLLTADAGDFTFYDCAYEELLQSLGPINDTSAIPWTMFNDEISKGYFDVYDQYLLNILYDPRIKPGMTVDEVRAVLPAVLVSVREWVAKINGLPQ